MNQGKKQVISKSRVINHGEVFTADREVNGMLDLVKQETVRVDSRFLEPACGTGNFLVEIIKRKLDTVTKRYSKSQIEYERYAISAMSSVYGIDILQDNVQECRNRLFDIFDVVYSNIYKTKSKPVFKKAIQFVLSRNIVWGDALSLKVPNEEAKPIVFSEWSRPFNNSLIKRRDYFFHELSPQENSDLFDTQVISDIGTHGFIPVPFKEFPLTHYLKLGEYAADNI